MRALLERIALAFWSNEVQYLAGRKIELEQEKARVLLDQADVAARLRRAEMRQLQYARVA